MILNLLKKRNFAIICDEAYSEFTNKKNFSLAKIDRNLKNSLIINSVKKLWYLRVEDRICAD